VSPSKWLFSECLMCILVRIVIRTKVQKEQRKSVRNCIRTESELVNANEVNRTCCQYDVLEKSEFRQVDRCIVLSVGRD